jgi:translation elongation factor P/translation initiation factor 5A
MQKLLPSSFRNGLVLMLEGSPFIIEDLHHTGTAKTKHKMHTRMRNLHNGRIVEHTFSENEEVATATLEGRRILFLNPAFFAIFCCGVATSARELIHDRQAVRREW